jgi:hypothetical protein
VTGRVATGDPADVTEQHRLFAILWLAAGGTAVGAGGRCGALQLVGDSAIFSAALTEVVPAQHLATGYSVRSILGFGMGALSPWLFGLVLDKTVGSSATAWGLAWTCLTIVALAGPAFTWLWRRSQVRGLAGRA